MLIDGISKEQLQLAALDTLKAAHTLAQDRVWLTRDWPLDPEWFPCLLISTPSERRVSLFPGQHAYNTTISLVVVGRILGASADEASDRVDVLSRQVEEALMLTVDFAGAIQQFVSINTSSVVNAESANHIGEFAIVFELLVYQAFGVDGPLLTDIKATGWPVPVNPNTTPINIEVHFKEPPP